MKISRKAVLTGILTIVCTIVTKDNLYAATGTITTETLNLRKSPSTESAIVELMSADEKVEVIKQEGDWYQVQYKGKSGYAYKDYIKLQGKLQEEEKPEESEKPEQKPQESETKPEEPSNIQENPEIVQAEITVKQVSKLYVLPLIHSKVVKEVADGEKGVQFQKTNAWSYVSIGGRNGWIRTSCIQIEGNVSHDPAPQPDKEPDEEPTATYERKTAYVNSESINVRQKPSMQGEVISTLPINSEVTIVGKEADWYKIEWSGKTGYVAERLLSDEKTEVTSRGDIHRAEQMEEENEPEESEKPQEPETVESKTMYIKVNVANIRKEATTKSDIVKTINKKESVQTIGEENGFYKIQLEEQVAYISKELLVESLEEIPEDKVEKPVEPAQTTTQNGKTEETSSQGAEIAAFSKKYLGYSYRYGGSSPSRGFDCSGFTMYVYKNFGYTLSHSATAQSKVGSKVEKSNLQLGDLVIFNDEANREIGHVGIFIGNNSFIHASNPSDGVKITSMSNSYYTARYVTARRLVK